MFLQQIQTFGIHRTHHPSLACTGMVTHCSTKEAVRARCENRRWGDCGVRSECSVRAQSWGKPSRNTRADKTPAVAPMAPQKDQKAQHHWPFHADLSQCDWTVRCSMEVASWLHLPRAARDQENQFLLKAWGPFSKTASVFASNHLTTAVEDNTLCLEREKLTLMEIG